MHPRGPSTALFLAIIVLIAGLLAGCGGGDQSGSGSQQDGGSQAKQEGNAPEKQEGNAPNKQRKNAPEKKILLGDVTFVKAEKAGPSVVVEGWATEDLEKLYDEWHERFEESDYEITFDEQEEHDAEISFEGGGRSGQVKLAAECGESGKTYARVTSRPTG